VSVLLITYTLRNSDIHNYGPFYEAIKSNSHEWWHFLDDTWIVTTSQTATQFASQLTPLIVTTDSVLVVPIVSKDFHGWLPPKAWEWLNSKEY
jgi:hypothetical protein